MMYSIYANKKMPLLRRTKMQTSCKARGSHKSINRDYILGSPSLTLIMPEQKSIRSLPTYVGEDYQGSHIYCQSTLHMLSARRLHLWVNVC